MYKNLRFEFIDGCLSIFQVHVGVLVPGVVSVVPLPVVVLGPVPVLVPVPVLGPDPVLGPVADPVVVPVSAPVDVIHKQPSLSGW